MENTNKALQETATLETAGAVPTISFKIGVDHGVLEMPVSNVKGLKVIFFLLAEEYGSCYTEELNTDESAPDVLCIEKEGMEPIVFIEIYRYDGVQKVASNIKGMNVIISFHGEENVSYQTLVLNTSLPNIAKHFDSEFWVNEILGDNPTEDFYILSENGK